MPALFGNLLISKKADAGRLRCDALFRMDREAAKVGGWENLAAQKPEVNDPSRPLLPLPDDTPEPPPED